MIRETYKGRKIVISKSRDYGYAAIRINGVAKPDRLGTQEAALAQTRRDIDSVGNEIDGASWGPEWYEPGTFEMCPNDHPQAIGGHCTHPYCNR